MNRRRFLAATGVGLIGLAGCVGAPRNANDEGASGTTTGTGTLARLRTTAECPSFRESVREVVCYDDVDPNEAAMYMEPSSKRAGLPEASIEFTLANGTGRSYTTNFYGWHVWKRVGDAWFYIEPLSFPVPAMVMEPGGSHAWTLSVDNTRLDGRPLGHVEGTERIDIAGLGGGRYAFGVDGWFEGDTHGNQTGFTATFDLWGDQIELTPTDEVTETIRDGDAVTVHTNVSDRSRRAAFVVTRLDDRRGDAGELITEQVMRRREFRNTLPFFEAGVRTVRLEEPNGTFPPFGVRDPYVIEYDGVQYRVEAESLETPTTDPRPTHG